MKCYKALLPCWIWTPFVIRKSVYYRTQKPFLELWKDNSVLNLFSVANIIVQVTNLVKCFSTAVLEQHAWPTCVLHLRHDRIRYASVNSSCPQPPSPGLTPGHKHFFCLAWQIPGDGDFWAVNFFGVETKKRANAPSSVNTKTFFFDCTVE